MYALHIHFAVPAFCLCCAVYGQFVLVFRWAKLTAGVFVRHGVPVYLFTTTTPTPFVPFSIKQVVFGLDIEKKGHFYSKLCLSDIEYLCSVFLFTKLLLLPFFPSQ